MSASKLRLHVAMSLQGPEAPFAVIIFEAFSSSEVSFGADAVAFVNASRIKKSSTPSQLCNVNYGMRKIPALPDSPMRKLRLKPFTEFVKPGENLEV